MADAQRTESELDALFADNSGIQDISAQDLRDFVESMQLAYGAYYFTSGSATTCTTAGDWYKIQGVTSAPQLNRFTHPTNNRLTYTGTPNVAMEIHYTISGAPAAGSTEFEVGIGVGGTVNDLGRSRLYYFSTIKYVHAGCAIISASTNDRIELYVRNPLASSQTWTVTIGTMVARAIFT